jgi:hypothetical protein
MDENFEQYIEGLNQEIIDAFTVEPDRNPSMFWTDFIMSRFMRVL